MSELVIAPKFPRRTKTENQIQKNNLCGCFNKTSFLFKKVADWNYVHHSHYNI